MEWYYSDGGQQIGPINEADLDSSVAAGVIKPETLIWRAGMAAWQPYAAARPGGEVAVSAASENTRFCSNCGASVPADELIQFGSSFICANCKPLFLQNLREGGIGAGTVHYGGFWIRFGAKFIDTIILYLVNLPMSLMWMRGIQPSLSNPMRFWASQGLLFLIQTSIGMVYDVALVTNYGGTLGKLALGLRIVTEDGKRLTWPRALGRHFANYLSAFTLMIGYIMAAFDDQKRALHDRICETRVVYKQ